MVGTRRTHGQPRRSKNIEAPRLVRPSGSSRASTTHPSRLGPVNEMGKASEHHISGGLLVNIDDEEKKFVRYRVEEFDEFCCRRR